MQLSILSFYIANPLIICYTDSMNTLQKYTCGKIYAKHEISEAPQSKKFRMHLHSTFEIFFFISGDVEYIVEGTKYNLQKNDILLIRPSESHMPYIKKNVRYERYVLNFPESLLKDADPEGRLLRVFTNRPLGQANLYSATQLRGLDIESLLRNICYRDEDNYEKNLRILTSALLILDALSSVRKKRISPTQSSSRENQIVNYVNAHLFDRITTNTLAQHFFLSIAQFNRIFKDATGTSVKAYVNAKRLIHAKEQIKNGLSAGEAAMANGFSDYTSFYRAYKKYFSFAPSEVQT